MKKKTVYISLPVRGQEEYSRKRAEEIENHYRKLGFNVINPHKIVNDLRDLLDREPTNSEIMSSCLDELGDSDFMALEPNWSESWGVNVEIIYAQHHGIDICEAMSNRKINFKSKLTNHVIGVKKDNTLLDPVKKPEFQMN
ncbi:MAG: DUF4406 domain-containing protein [Bacteroidales bacterium]